MTMTTYPLEFYLCLKGTPHIKIVDWNLHDEMTNYRFLDQGSFEDNRNMLLRLLKRLSSCPEDYQYLSQPFPDPEQHVLAVQDSDQHLLLVLQYGNEDWIELSEQEAKRLMHGDEQ
jgi:hypothetical protein